MRFGDRRTRSVSPGRIYFAGGITEDHFEPTSPTLNYFNGNGLGLATDYTGGAGHVGGPIYILEVVV